MSIILLVYVGEEKEVKKVKERVGANEKRHWRHEMKRGAEAPLQSPQSPRPTQQKRKRRKTKRVRFAKRDQVKDTIHINDLKRLTDIRNIWYTEEETKAAVSSCQDMVQLIESGLPFDTHTECTRGLEGYVAREMKHRRQVAMEALLTVLEEQDLQRSEGVYNPELLADLYFFRSYQCGDAAHQVALQDERDIFA